MPSLPWIKWFASKWLSSSARITMSLAARAIYLDLLFQIYECGGSIPSDRKQLYKLTMTTPDEFEAAWPEIAPYIVPLDSDPSRLTNPTASHFLKKLTQEYQTSVESGRRGGRPRKGQAKGGGNHVDVERDVDVDLEREEDKDTHNASSDARVCDSSFISPKLPRTEVISPQQEVWFQAWWSIFWSKKNRLRARDAFAVRVRTRELFEQIMRATKEQTRHEMARDPQYRPSPLAWLEGERWLDELEEPRGGLD